MIFGLYLGIIAVGLMSLTQNLLGLRSFQVSCSSKIIYFDLMFTEAKDKQQALMSRPSLIYLFEHLIILFAFWKISIDTLWRYFRTPLFNVKIRLGRNTDFWTLLGHYSRRSTEKQQNL